MSIQRLDDASLARLEEILESRIVPRGGMSLEMLDGFLCALMVTPDLVPPSEYLPHIWNAEQVWETPQEAEEALGLVMALWNDISRRVSAPLPDPEEGDQGEAGALLDAVMPLLAIPDDLDLFDEQVLEAHADLPVAAAWANGFLVGVGLREAQWEAWADADEAVADDLEDLSRMALFDEEQAVDLGLTVEDMPVLADRLELIAELPYLLNDLNWKRLERQRPEPARRADVPGRNDPCLCGSGQKFKKCCGAPGKLN